jgi:STE24 endopeptidase
MALFSIDLDNYISPRHLLWIIIAGTFIEYLFELYLNLRQNKVYRTAKQVPQVLRNTLDKETFEKSRDYGKDKNLFSTFSDAYSMITLTALLLCDGLYKGWELTDPMLNSIGVWPNGWDVEIGRSMCFSIIAMLFNTVVGLPLSIYSTFVLEEKHGFNKQTVGFFIKDFIKKILVSTIIMTPIVGLIVKIVQAGGELFFIYLWAFSFAVLMFFMTIYPVAIAPLFDKYTPLKEGPLKARIEALAARIKFPLTKLYVVEGSKRSAHSNAYLYGFFKNKRIVLFDTLIKGYVAEESPAEEPKPEAEKPGKKEEEKGCSDEEIEAVLGHELGHWKLSHVVKNIVISQVNLLFVFAFFAFFQKSSVLYEAFGFPRNSEKPVFIGLIIILQFLLQIYNTAMGYIMNVLSRLYEFQADQFAVELGYGKDLKSALVKLNKDNLGFPISDPLYSAWHHSHPTLLQRLAAIDADMAKNK